MKSELSVSTLLHVIERAQKDLSSSLAILEDDRATPDDKRAALEQLRKVNALLFEYR